MVDLTNLPRPELNSNLKSLLASNNISGNYPILSYILIGIFLLIIVIGIIFLIRYLIKLFSRKKENNFQDLLTQGNSALNTQDLETAKNIYSKLKSIVETTKDSNQRALVLNFYNKIMEAIRK